MGTIELRRTHESYSLGVGARSGRMSCYRTPRRPLPDLRVVVDQQNHPRGRYKIGVTVEPDTRNELRIGLAGPTKA